MVRRRVPQGPIWPAWFYGPDDQSGVFYMAEDVPEQWSRRKGNAPPASVELSREAVILNETELITELMKRNIEINPTWGHAHMKRIIDGDISPTW